VSGANVLRSDAHTIVTPSPPTPARRLLLRGSSRPHEFVALDNERSYLGPVLHLRHIHDDTSFVAWVQLEPRVTLREGGGMIASDRS
jgi:hypothetical protein